MNTISKIFAGLAAVAAFSSCLKFQENEKFDSDGKYFSKYSISEWLASEYGENYSMYSQMLSQSSYHDIFSKTKDYTFVIPTNSAIRTWLLANEFPTVEDVPLNVADSVIAYLTIPQRVYSKNIEADSTKLYYSLADSLPICVYRTDASYPYQLFINRNTPVLEKKYVAEKAEVITQDTEFTDHTADFVNAVPSWKWKGGPTPPPVPPTPSGKIAAPVLSAKVYSLCSRESAFVAWEDVKDASGYTAAVNGAAVPLTSNTIDFSGQYGEFEVKVCAISALPDSLDDSDTSVVKLTLLRDEDFGTGSETDPWKLYSAADWNDWAGLVTGGKNYSGEYVLLKNDIDFKGTSVASVGINGNPFKGTFDGDNHTISNGVVDDGNVEAGVFRRAEAVISNLKVKKFNINGYSVNGTMARVGGFNGGKFTGQITNCHMEGCTITATVISGNNNQAGGFVSFIDDSKNNTVIKDCSLKDCSISAVGAEMVGGIAGQMKNANKIIGCKVTGTTINGLRIIGAVAGQITANGLVEGCVVSKSRVSAQTRNASCLVGDLTGSVFNCICEGNMVNIGGGASPYGAGVLASIVNNGGVVANCVSRNNAVSCSDETMSQPYLSLGIGTNKKAGLTYVAANLFVQSGTMRYDAASAKYVGIITATLETSKLTNCFYDTSLRETVDISEKPKTRYGCGAIGDEQNLDSDGTIGIDPADIAKSEGGDALITKLNEWVKNNKSTYPLLKSWVMESGAPTIKSD